MSNMSGRRKVYRALLNSDDWRRTFHRRGARRRRCRRRSDRPGARAGQEARDPGLSMGPQAQTDPAAGAAEDHFMQTVRNRPTRSLWLAEREEIATIVKNKPKIDLEINFDYDSANISAYGETNRRVQVANMNDKATAST